MISAVTPLGVLHFDVFTGRFDAEVFVEFLKKLVHDTNGPIFLVLDNHSVHKARIVRDYVDSLDGRLKLFFLPPYSPELNPDEWVWKNVKHDGVAPAAPKGPEQMKAVITARLRRLQRLPHLVRGFFGDPELAYISAVA